MVFAMSQRVRRAARWLTGGALAVGLISASVAVAQTAPPHERVKTYDLDLKTPEGHAQLNRRIRAAARRVCSFDGPRLSVGSGRCEMRAIAEAQEARARAVQRASSAPALAYDLNSLRRVP